MDHAQKFPKHRRQQETTRRFCKMADTPERKRKRKRTDDASRVAKKQKPMNPPGSSPVMPLFRISSVTTPQGPPPVIGMTTMEFQDCARLLTGTSHLPRALCASFNPICFVLATRQDKTPECICAYGHGVALVFP